MRAAGQTPGHLRQILLIYRPRRTQAQAAVLGIAACAILAASLVSCSPRHANPSAEQDSALANQGSGFLVPESGSLVLILGIDGQLEQVSGLADGPLPGVRQGPEPAPFAIQTAVSAVQAPIDEGAIIAINRSGLVHLTVQDRTVQLRRIEGAGEEFAGRSVAQSWTWDGKAMFLLHRNEIFEPEAARSPASRIIAAKADGFAVLPVFDPATGTTSPEDRELYGAPFALFPRADKGWLVQFRLVGTERTRTAFATWNPDQNLLSPLERQGYEAAVSPAPLSEAPVVLRRAAEALGGSLIMDATMPDGSHLAWLRGDTATMLVIQALVTDDASAISLGSDGRVIMVTATMVHESRIAMPVPGAYFRDLALLNGYIIAVWEEDLFPDIGRSGLVIMDVSGLSTE